MIPESPQPNVGGSAGLPLRFWLLVPPTGIATGLAAGLLMWLLDAVQHLAWPVAGNFLADVESASPAHRVAIVAAAGLIAAAARLLLARATGGHGGELNEAVWFHAGRMPFFRTMASAVVSIVVVGLGASLGREAAPKQAGAAIASAVACLTGLAPGHRRLLVALATGAGIGAVYNVPFGGAAFALEVLLGSLALPLVPPALAVSGLATMTAWLLLPDRPTYQVAFFPVSPALIAWSVLAGPLAGLASALYVKLICWADARRPTGIGRLLAPLIVFTVLGALAIPLPQLLGNGKDAVQLAFDGRLGVGLIVALVILKPLATAACLGSGAPGGLFTPSLTFGAAFGALMGVVWSLVWPGIPPGAYALIGAAGVLAGTTQGPVSAIVLMIELTRRLDTLILPVAITVAGAAYLGSLLDRRSVYSGRIHLGRDTAGGTDAISAAARYAELLQALLQRAGCPLRVVDESGNTLGIVDNERARKPRDGDGPLATAAAGDFLSG